MTTKTKGDIMKAREQRAHEHLEMCMRLCKKLELPIEALDVIDRVVRNTGSFDIDAALEEAARDELLGKRMQAAFPDVPLSGIGGVSCMGPLQRAPIRLRSEKAILKDDWTKGRPAIVIARPQMSTMQVEEIEILGEPDDWMIADITVGGRTQFPHNGDPIPGRLFKPGGTCHRFITETIQTAMEFAMHVHYIGECHDSFFEAVAMGTLTKP